MEATYTRRQILERGATGLLGLSLLGLAACGSTTSATSTSHLQLFFWGSASRDKLTTEAIKLFEKKHSNAKITSQYTAFDAYWTKLSTQIAGSSAPDLIQMDMRYIAEYVKKGLLLNLTPSIEKKSINLSDFDQTLLDGSKVNGSVYGVPMGGNYQCLLTDQTLIEKAKVGALPANFTWDEFGNYCKELSKALKTVSGTGDESTNVTAFELWVRQRGRDLYTTDGKIGFTQDDAAEWFNYWSGLRKSGACVPIQTAAGSLTGGTPTTNLVKGQAVFSFTLSNLLDAFQTLMKDKVGIHMPPTGKQAGMYLKASMLMSVSATTHYTDLSASFIDFINNNSDAVKTLGVERGVPGSAKARTILAPQLTPTQKLVLDYITLVGTSGNARSKTILDPAGAGAVEQSLTRNAQAVGFGRTSISDGAKTFYAEAQKAIS